MRHSVLLVDDERFARTVYSDYLRATGYDVAAAEDAASALAALRSRRFDVLITDVILPGSDGLELLAAAKQLDPDIEALVITALDRVDPAVRAMKSGASDYLVKPVTPEALQVAVQRCLSTRALLAENKALRAHLQLFETCQRLAASMERDKLVQMALAAVASECDGKGAVLLERGRGGAFTATGRHEVQDAEAEALLEVCEERLPGLSAAEPMTLPPLARLGVPVLFPVTDGETLLAAVCVIVPGPPSAERLGGAQFVCRHFGLALRTFGQLKQVEHLAYLDDLTHLYNCRFLDLALEREIQSGRPFTVLFMDLDRFKNVNDTHGHLNGSKLLVEVARVLRACVRDDDVVARYGGDEYVALLLGIDSGVGLKVAERIRRAIEDHVFLSREASRVHITASIGLASYPEHTRDKAEVLDLADRAMYRGKRSTRNVVYLASKDLPPAPVR
ncbi:MAG TPA: diguanylate cyclase [Anaeromyxobacteraceae bacterium]|jgi:diguanylate cyclase (GGDEF)-like protein|nr:diguanylate cyclase [Anaeromyxobacteraceae bacterium]